MSTQNAELHKEFEDHYDALGLNIMNIPLPYVPILFREWKDAKAMISRIEALEACVVKISRRLDGDQSEEALQILGF